MPNTFKVNDEFPLDPNELSKSLLKAGYGVSGWINKANSFTYRRGTEASSGYFLFPADAPIGGQVELKVQVFDPSEDNPDPITIQGLEIASQECINPAFNSEDAIYLTHIVDPLVHIWEREYVEKDYNIVLTLSGGSPVYDPSTLNASSPWSWEEIFDNVAGHDPNDTDPEAIKFTFDEADFPTLTPQGVQFKSVRKDQPFTRKEALSYLLRVTGHTILRTPDKQLKVTPIDASTIEADLEGFRNKVLRHDKHPLHYQESLKTPDKIKFRFPKLPLGLNLTNKYTDKVKDLGSGGEETWIITAFLNDTGSNGTDLDTYADHFETKLSDLFDTKDGFRTEQSYHNLVNLKPTKAISQVAWIATHRSVPHTYITTLPGIDFPKQSHEFLFRDTTLKGVGVNTTAGSAPTLIEPFKVQSVELFSGCLDYITAGVEVTDVYLLFPGQSINEGSTLLVHYNQSAGRFEAFIPGDGGGGQSSTELLRFELIEDMDIDQERAEAILLDAEGKRIITNPPMILKTLLLTMSLNIIKFTLLIFTTMINHRTLVDGTGEQSIYQLLLILLVIL